MANYILGIACLILGFLIGFIVFRKKPKDVEYDGAIILDQNENGDDRIVFLLNFEYDEIASKEKIIFNVIDKNKGL